jgi:adenine-specific DNA-methyltransferase
MPRKKGGGKAAPKGATKPAGSARTESYRHPEAESLLRPDVGTQAQFRKKKPPARYRYDSSLSPALDWDGQNPAREAGEAKLAAIEAQLAAATQRLAAAKASGAADAIEAAQRAVEAASGAARELAALSRPFLNWAGKAERLSFDVPTLPLFVHERLSTKAILETLKGHKRDKQIDMFDLFADPRHPIHDQVLRAYEYPDKWVNRMVLGDSLVVMNSLLHYEGMGGQVQMIYMDPPYGVKFGSNFQPFVRKRDVAHNDDEDMTREPEMVKAYRDTWELGLHSYLTYLRDRLLLCRELLAPSGSVFVQIGDENVHHVREVMDEVFGSENFVSLISFAKTTGSTGDYLPGTTDHLVFYARDIERLKYHQPHVAKSIESETGGPYSWVELSDGTRRRMTPDERANPQRLPVGARVYRLDNLQSQSIGREKGEGAASWFPVEFNGKEWRPGQRSRWKTNQDGMARLKAGRRLEATAGGLYYVRYIDDFPAQIVGNSWTDTVIAGFASDKSYVVETSPKVIERCLLMTTDPGDLALDPTCGSGTTAYVAEQWGRRWITIDTSRVPLALARQRLLTATFPFHQLREPARGPAGGFAYVRKQNKKGEEVGGIVPHVTLKSIANGEPPQEEVLVDRPEPESGITRVTGPFCFEATVPTPVDWEGDGQEDSGVPQESYGSFVDRMIEVLRKSPVLHLAAGKTVTLHHVRVPAKTLSLSAEAVVSNGDGSLRARDDGTGPTAYPQPPTEDASGEPARVRIQGSPVAIVFGPESGAVSEKLVFEAAREAHAKSYTHLYVIGFAIQPNARELVEKCEAVVGVPATYVQATPDLMMGDLLKNMRSSQIFSVCGLPDVEVRPAAKNGEAPRYEVELRGLDVFDPVSMEAVHRGGDDVPAWLLDTDYNGLCFHVCQAFFPRTAAWDDLRRALRTEFDDAVWAHLAGTVSAPFEAGEHRQVAVKVIDDRGNELLVVKPLPKARK